MSKQLDSIDDQLAAWLHEQHVFFVATAPRSDDGHINCSPKGGDCFRVLGPMEVAYQDYTGSGSETIAHVLQNQRIVLMFCAFAGKPSVARLHGRAEAVTRSDPRYAQLCSLFPASPGARAVIRVAVTRVSTSCGFAVPQMDFRGNRDSLDKWARNKGPEALELYRREKNAISIDGLPALTGEGEELM